MPDSESHDGRFLRVAARLALRGHGGAEPNPLVGCVIVSPTYEIVGWGYHRQCGGDHAERCALRRAGDRARGATVYVTLEPCNHTGRTPPCVDALIEAGVARVVFACTDPNPVAEGGAARLREAGIQCDLNDECRAATEVAAPFLHRQSTGLPWVIAKWAQTVDGRIATRTGASRWISGNLSRRYVHRKRGRVDAVLTGIGTVLADDPMLTARGVRVRRIARRIVVDADLQTPLDSRLVQTAREAPVTVVCSAAARESFRPHADELEAAGVDLHVVETDADTIPLAATLRDLTTRHDLTNILVEAGAGLLGGLFAEGLVNEAIVFIAPLILGDEEALPCVRGLCADELTDGVSMSLQSVRRRGDDLFARYLVRTQSP